MHQYHIKATESDWPQVLQLGVLLGVLQESEGQHYATSGAWDFIGPVYRPTGETVLVDEVETPVTEPVRDAEGNLYLHGNLRTTIDMKAAADALAVSNPDIAGALSQLGRYLLLDEEGKARAPANPARVFMGG